MNFKWNATRLLPTSMLINSLEKLFLFFHYKLINFYYNWLDTYATSSRHINLMLLTKMLILLFSPHLTSIVTFFCVLFFTASGGVFISWYFPLHIYYGHTHREKKNNSLAHPSENRRWPKSKHWYIPPN